MSGYDLDNLTNCKFCPRLVAYRSSVALKKGRTRSDYLGAPVPGFGDLSAPIALIGMAPGAQGANRTGRPFTGDGAGDFMFPLLYEAGLANGPESVALGDGFELTGLYITNAVKCVPPENKATTEEFNRCRPYLQQELDMMPNLKLVILLGLDAFKSYLKLLRDGGQVKRLADYPFGHEKHYDLQGGPALLASYHTSRYNVQTGRMTQQMFLSLLDKAKKLADR